MQVPAPFDYARATSVEEALALLDRLGPEARLIAGGHSLLPMMKLRLATPEHLIDINPLEGELRYIREDGERIHIGALTRHRDLLESNLLARCAPIFFDAEQVIADPPVRNRGTQDCDPIADQRGPADYKRHLARELTHRALRRAAERALAEEV